MWGAAGETEKRRKIFMFTAKINIFYWISWIAFPYVTTRGYKLHTHWRYFAMVFNLYWKNLGPNKLHQNLNVFCILFKQTVEILQHKQHNILFIMINCKDMCLLYLEWPIYFCSVISWVYSTSERYGWKQVDQGRLSWKWQSCFCLHFVYIHRRCIQIIEEALCSLRIY